MDFIQELIKDRSSFSLNSKNRPWKDEWLEYVYELEPSETVCIITTASSLKDERILSLLERKYHITAAFNIGKIFLNTSIPFYLVELSKQPAKGLKTGIYKGRTYNRSEKTQNRDTLTPPMAYQPEWQEYIHSAFRWMSGNEIPADREDAEFSYVRPEQLLEGSLYPEDYTTEKIELREILAREHTYPLDSVADILVPRETQFGECCRILSVRDLEYPISMENLSIGKPTTVVLQKGDIVVPRIKSSKNAFLFNIESPNPIFASHNLFVIRCNSILPEYLYFYLSTDVALAVLDAACTGTILKTISEKQLKNLPIAKPNQGAKGYIAAFNAIANPTVRHYDKVLPDYYADKINRIEQHSQKADTLEDIINVEKTKQLRMYNKEQLSEFLTKDVEELNICYRNKAYKATLILAGSILEAVLIDWLSEIDQCDYFAEDYMVYNKKTGQQVKGTLFDYIDAIKKIKQPNWSVQADRAHEIREKRNYVHAKLCLNESEIINDNLCKKVVSYLKDILRTRGIKANR